MAVTVTKEYLGAIAPEYCDIDQRRLDVLNSAAISYASEDVFGDETMLARAFIIAHLAKTGDNNGAGIVTSERVGDLSRSYSGPQGSPLDWDLTTYGKQFKRLAKLVSLPQADKFVI